MHDAADDEGRDEHQHDGQGEHRPLVLPELDAVRPTRLVVEQRCDEQDQEEFRVERRADGRDGEDCDQKAEHDLDEMGVNLRDELVDDGGRQYRYEIQQYELESFQRRTPEY